jgi:hypothetical protein
MTDLLARAIAQIEKLPAEEQDAIAARILADLEDERAWKAQFGATTGEQWDKLAGAARQKIAAGDTLSLDDVFPPKDS